MHRLEKAVEECKEVLKKPKEELTLELIQDCWNTFFDALKLSRDEDLDFSNLIDEVLPLFFRTWLHLDIAPLLMYKTCATAVKIQNQINSLQTTGVFTNATLKDIHESLRTEKEIIANISVSNQMANQGLLILKARIELCQKSLDSLFRELTFLSPALVPIHSRLVELKYELQALLGRKSAHAFSLVEVEVIQEEVREIDSARTDGKYLSMDGNPLHGHASVANLVESCFDDIHELLASKDPVHGENPLRFVYEELIKIKSSLEAYNTFLTPGILQGDELIPFQVALGRIDNMRSDGKFLAEDGSCPAGQAVIHFLLHKCYRLIFKLQSNIEPVAASLMPIYNQLNTLERLLLQLVKWNVSMTHEEMIPYQIKLSSIVKLQKDGKYEDSDGQVPEGQAIIFEKIEQCHHLMEMLKPE